MYALAERRIVCSEKMVLKLGFVLMVLAVFSGQNMTINAFEPNSVLQEYIQENTIYKEQSNDEWAIHSLRAHTLHT